MALGANRSIQKASTRLAGDVQKLSSGLRINSFADDAAGGAISEKMRAQIRGLNRAALNIQDGISLTQTAEGGMQGISNMIHRQRELIVQALNDTNSTTDKAAIQLELDQLTAEIDSMANTTEFNGLKLLNRSAGDVQSAVMTQVVATAAQPPVDEDGRLKLFAVDNNGVQQQMIFGSGSTSNPAININGTVYNIWDSANTTATDNGPPPVWSTTRHITDNGLDVEVIQHVSVIDNPAGIGGQSYAITYEVKNNTAGPLTFDFMYHIDTQLGSNDSAPFSVAGNEIQTEQLYTGAGIPPQINIYDSLDNPYINGVITVRGSGGYPLANEPDKVFLGRWAGNADRYFDPAYTSSGNLNGEDTEYAVLWTNRMVAAGQTYAMTTYYGVQNPPPIPAENDFLFVQSGANKGDDVRLTLYDCRAKALGIDNIVTDPRDLAKDSLGRLDAALNRVSLLRANAGAEYNRLESKMANVNNSAENLQAAESRIRDIDMAKAMTSKAVGDILLQSSTSMLTQANAIPQSVLQLMR